MGCGNVQQPTGTWPNRTRPAVARSVSCPVLDSESHKPPETQSETGTVKFPLPLGGGGGGWVLGLPELGSCAPKAQADTKTLVRIVQVDPLSKWTPPGAEMTCR